MKYHLSAVLDVKPDVVIIGAGPAGMMLAYLLVTNGISVRVLERHPDFKREFRDEGIQPSVMAILDELGFTPVLVEKGIAIPADQAKIFLDGKLVVTLGGLEKESDDFGLIVFQIYWLKIDAPPYPALIPGGFQAYLKDDSMYIFYRTYDHRLQVAWGKREWDLQSFRDLDQLKKQLIAELPRDYRSMAAKPFGEHTERQLLKIACERMQRWSVPGMLFIGDAAHTMSPVAGQGINLAVGDTIVTSNHLITARRQGLGWDSALLQKIEAERRTEVEALQAFQVSLGYLMLGAPRWQIRLVFRWFMPVLSALGIRQHYGRQVQGGKSTVKL